MGDHNRLIQTNGLADCIKLCAIPVGPNTPARVPAVWMPKGVFPCRSLVRPGDRYKRGRRGTHVSSPGVTLGLGRPTFSLSESGFLVKAKQGTWWNKI